MRNRVQWATLIFFGFFLSMLVLPIFRPELVAYVTIVAIGSALALQKYIASFAGHFVLKKLKLFEVGHRIRIGNIKGDVRDIGILHFILDEVGEGDKSGGELTGRVIHVPNHTVLDQPVVNFSQDFSNTGHLFHCDYLFDEVRLPLPDGITIPKSREILGQILHQEDKSFIEKAKESFGKDSPNFLDEATRSPRVMIFVDDKRTWLVGRFVAPVRGRNELRSVITCRFLEEIEEIQRENRWKRSGRTEGVGSQAPVGLQEGEIHESI